MAEFKVIKTQIEVFPHPNADNLELLKVGNFQLVIQKGAYKSGDIGIIAPCRAILPDNLAEPFRKYLRGEQRNRVGSIRLRGELSQGVLLPSDEIDPKGELPTDTNLADILGIREYEPPIPLHLEGEVEPLVGSDLLVRHDCENFSIYQNSFVPNEVIHITEKLHGSQIVIVKDAFNNLQISSKGLFSKGLCLKPQGENAYWQAVFNTRLQELLCQFYADRSVQAFGEIIPVQSGYNYGYDRSQPTLKLFRILIDGVETSYNSLPPSLQALWVPTFIYHFDREYLTSLGRDLKRSYLDPDTVAEGIVISPIKARKAADGTPLYLKIISDAYAKVEIQEAFS